jgi:hypothetical protein
MALFGDFALNLRLGLCLPETNPKFRADYRRSNLQGGDRALRVIFQRVMEIRICAVEDEQVFSKALTKGRSKGFIVG